jgi:hypothetical protein
MSAGSLCLEKLQADMNNVSQVWQQRCLLSIKKSFDKSASIGSEKDSKI